MSASTPADEQKQRMVTLIALAFGLLGLLLAVPGFHHVHGAMASSSWPTVQGTILSSEVECTTTGNKSSFRPRVVYRYSVDGKGYSRNQPALHDAVSNKTTGPEATVARYSEGQQVTVSFDPQDPQISVLEPGVTLRSAALLLVGLAFFGFGVLSFALRKYAK